MGRGTSRFGGAESCGQRACLNDVSVDACAVAAVLAEMITLASASPVSGALETRLMETKAAATRLEELVSKCCAAKDGTLCTDVHVRVSARPCDHLREFVSCHESHHR